MLFTHGRKSGDQKMYDVEKVLDGLRRCSSEEGFYNACVGCPYVDAKWGKCTEHLLEDAIVVIEQLREELGKA